MMHNLDTALKKVSMEKVRGPFEKRSCSFERIYFSRGSDSDIYRERKKLGELLTPAIVKVVDDDLDNTVFSLEHIRLCTRRYWRRRFSSPDGGPSNP